jgi:hypothetical protein
MIIFFTDRYFRFLKSFRRLVISLSMVYSRIKVRRVTKQVVKKAGRSVMNRKLKKTIKAYARERFGSEAYWPHLAHYTEMRGEFIKGWIPEDYFHYILEPRLNPPAYNNLGDLRTSDYRRFGDFAIQPLFLFVTGNFYNADFEPVDQGKVMEFLASYDNKIVVKQEFGWGGKQVRVIQPSEFKPGQLHRGNNYIIQPFIKQYHVLNDLNPDSVNTFRVITFQKRNGSVEVLLALLRFGVDGTKVDNLSSGGQCICFDRTGKPAKIARDEFGMETGERHKNSGFVFSELEIPMFHKIVDSCRTAHQKYPYIRLIGWDICVDESGQPKLIEWNTHWPSFTWEDGLFGPFLTDDRELE